jgi:hypothetical protein
VGVAASCSGSKGLLEVVVMCRLPSVSNPADASTAVGEDWHSKVVVVELMDDGHDTIFTTYLPLPRVVERKGCPPAGE